MLHKTRGVVLHKLKYSDNSIIVKAYTEQFGIQSYIQQGVRSKKSVTKLGLFQPAALLDMEVYNKVGKDLHRIKEAKALPPFQTIPFDFKKSAIALFLAEVLYKSLKEEEPNQKLYDFIHYSIITLDESNDNISDFHLIFLIELSHYLGFGPQGNWNNSYFNLNDGEFSSSPLPGDTALSPAMARVLWEILGMKFAAMGKLKLNRKIRNSLLNSILEYYYIHLSGMREIKSHQVLESVMD